MTFTDDRVARQTAATSPSGWYASGGKRVLDLAAVLPIIAVAAPVLATAAVALRIKLGPGILLRQTRVGRNAEEFEMLKFRTMEQTRRLIEPDGFNGEDRRSSHKSITDPRHTRLGRTLRKFSIDELPQLFNVLKGDMALVGPRPQLAVRASPSFRAHDRHLVRPGLTGPFQVSPLRSHGDLDAGLDIDHDYVESLNLRGDLAFLFGTLFALLRGTGN